jgi:hypothetical protein
MRWDSSIHAHTHTARKESPRVTPRYTDARHTVSRSTINPFFVILQVCQDTLLLLILCSQSVVCASRRGAAVPLCLTSDGRLAILTGTALPLRITGLGDALPLACP